MRRGSFLKDLFANQFLLPGISRQQTIFLIHLRFLVQWFDGSMVPSSMKKQPISNLFTSANHWLAFKILCLAVANQQCFYNEWISCAQYKLRSIQERVMIEVSFIDNLYFSEPFFVHVLWLVEEAFIKVVKPSVSIQEADSAHLCHFQLCFYIDRIRSIHGRKQILMTSFHGDCKYLHSLRINSYLIPTVFQ